MAVARGHSPVGAPMNGVVQLVGRGVIFTRGGGPNAHPSLSTPSGDYFHEPPMGVVVGAGAVGALAGHLVFHSLLVSVGLGVGAMSLAASSDDRAGEIARSSGRLALAAFDRTAEVNERYRLTERLFESARTTGRRLKEFDKEHAVVHRATAGAKKAWRDVKQYDETHGISTRAGTALSSGLDKLTEALTPPVNPSRGSDQAQGGGSSSRRSPSRSAGSDYRGRGRGLQGIGGSASGRERAYAGMSDDGRREDTTMFDDSRAPRDSLREDELPDVSPPWRGGEGEGGGDDWWQDDDAEEYKW